MTVDVCNNTDSRCMGGMLSVGCFNVNVNASQVGGAR